MQMSDSDISHDTIATSMGIILTDLVQYKILELTISPCMHLSSNIDIISNTKHGCHARHNNMHTT